MEIKYSTKTHTVEEAFDQLESIFADKKVDLINTTNSEITYKIRLPYSSEWYVDPAIFELKSNELDDLPKYYLLNKYGEKIFLKTHFHYNALRGAIEYEQSSGKKIDCIIHFDDHSDMMPIYKMENEVSSYRDKIRHGELAIGNFLTNYLVNNPIDVYHIQNSKSLSFKEEQYNYFAARSKEIIGNLEFEKIKLQKTVNSPTTYFRMNMNTFEDISIEGENIWLDIDLDYFCNRFNRDSDWKKNRYFDRTFDEMNKDVSLFLDKLKEFKWLNKVKVLTVASSPGFFPFSYLNFIEKGLINELQKVIEFGEL